MRNIKLIILALGLLTIDSMPVSAQEVYPYAMPAPEGIYIMCGSKIPRNFEYQIYRHIVGNNQWEKIGSLKYDYNFDGFFNQLIVANGHNNIYELPLETNKGKIWQLIENAGDVDSIPFIGNIPMYREALGTCFYDLTALKDKIYEYKVIKIFPNGKKIETLTKSTHYPANKINYNIKLISQNPQEKYIHLKYNIGKRNKIYTTRLYRSFYMQTDFKPSNAKTGFSEIKDSLQVWAIDSISVKKAILQYYLQAYDLYGNAGIASDTVKVVNLMDKAETMITAIHTESNQKLQAINVSWKCLVPEYLRSIEVYRSNTYDGEYKYIASASPKDTLFIDTQVNANKNYFYYLIINNAYGRSERSVRIAGILVGNSKALPPFELKAKVKTGLVQLSWKKPSADTYAYYLMRSDEGSLNFRQIGGLIKNDSISINYTDTIKSLKSNVLTYSIKSVNTSYNVSEMTEAIYVNPILNINLTSPINLITHYSDNQILVTWNDVSEIDNNVIAYKLLRRVINNPNIDKPKFEALIPQNEILTNIYYEDKNVKEGYTYEYQVLALGTNSTQSEPSISSIINIPSYKPVSINSIQVYNTTAGMLINWNKTMQENIKQYKIYRWQNNKSPLLIATLSVDKTSFIDVLYQKDSLNQYAISCVNSNNVESTIENWSKPQN